MHSSKAVVWMVVCGMAASAADFSGASALEFTKKAVSYGPRVAGTPANQKLQAYIKSELKTLGCMATDDRFTASTPAGSREMNNIIARIAGTSGKAVVFTGHYDTKPMPGILFVGANDGGSSTGVLLGLAQSLCRKKFKDDVYVVWLDGEEAFAQWSDSDSLYGSRHLADKWSGDGTARKVKALINLDMIGDKDLDVAEEMNSTSWLRQMVWESAKELGYAKHFTHNQGYIEDDHIPFLKAGIPALDLIDFNYGPDNSYWHTEKDTVDKLSAESLAVMGKTMLRTLEKLEAK